VTEHNPKYSDPYKSCWNSVRRIRFLDWDSKPLEDRRRELQDAEERYARLTEKKLREAGL